MCPLFHAAAPLRLSPPLPLLFLFLQLPSSSSSSTSRVNRMSSDRPRVGWSNIARSPHTTPHQASVGKEGSPCAVEGKFTPRVGSGSFPSVKPQRTLLGASDQLPRASPEKQVVGSPERGGGKCGFDLCPPPKEQVFQLKRSLLQVNRERRRMLARCSTSGPQRIMLKTGMVLLKNYLGHRDQVEIVRQCRGLGLGPGGFYQPGYRDGAKLHLQMMCLGKNRDPQTHEYREVRVVDGAVPPPIPGQFKKLVESAMWASHDLLKKDYKCCAEDVLPNFLPDICIVNFYSMGGKLGLHQDRDESKDSLLKGLPVVSFSVGDSAEFSHGVSREAEETLKLESGDVLIFGGGSRHIFHGVTQIYSGTAPKNLVDETNLRPGRLNLTFRQY